MTASESFDNWTTQVRKGLLEVSILNALLHEERYAYDLVKALIDLPGLGVTEGTLYPLLSRLRLQGLVKTRLEESSQGPARKYYALTPEGRRIATLMNEHIDQLHRGLTKLREKGA